MNKPKFRAWDDVNRKMITSFNERVRIETKNGFYKPKLQIANGNEIQAKLYFATKEEMIYRPYKDLPTMQYTGLKDKNGVEIYEGSCIEGKYPNGRKFKGIVEYSTDRAGYIVKTTYSWKPSSLDMCSDCTVIGSIHENPELLSGVE